MYQYTYNNTYHYIIISLYIVKYSQRMLRVFAVFYSILLHLLTFFTLTHELRSHGNTHDCMEPVVGEGNSISNNTPVLPNS